MRVIFPIVYSFDILQLKYFDDSTWEPTQNAIASFEEELRIKVKSLKFSSEDSRPELISQKVIQSQTLTFRWLVQIFKTELGLYRYRYFAKEKGAKKIKLSIRWNPKKRQRKRKHELPEQRIFLFLGVFGKQRIMSKLRQKQPKKKSRKEKHQRVGISIEEAKRK